MTQKISRQELASTYTVCIGGGTGVPSSIKALASLGIYPDAVISVADDGGSSGLLRTHTGQVPPGDIRKCLVALARNQQNPWVKAFKERFEYANDHTLGNLILTALQQTTGSITESIELCEALLETCGHVYPASFTGVLLMGITQDGKKLVGQSTLCKSHTALKRVILEPEDPPANPAAVKAIQNADLIVLGPGSLFTSIIPNLLIPDIRDAIATSKAARVFICPIADVQGETWGLDAAELTDALLDHGLEGCLDYVLINREEQKRESGNVTGYFSAIGSAATTAAIAEHQINAGLRPVIANDEVVSRIRDRGVKVLIRAMSAAQTPSWHDPQTLAAALASVIADSKRG
ncbi:MAG: YvcK family protein [Coriobacteriia bacterium]|nr:YvcK family protein [Coriobacteriia bacterium]MCL2750369.1 YvcK family protein [Coriobacteriia bacterium]